MNEDVEYMDKARLDNPKDNMKSIILKWIDTMQNLFYVVKYSAKFEISCYAKSEFSNWSKYKIN